MTHIDSQTENRSNSQSLVIPTKERPGAAKQWTSQILAVQEKKNASLNCKVVPKKATILRYSAQI